MDSTSEEVQPARSPRLRVPPLLGAGMLMAMSAAGPGFITQTASFTVLYQASFAAAVVLSMIVDVAVQLNVWRILGISGQRAQDLAGKVFPGAGQLLTALVVLGAVVFNIGNIGGAGLGLHNLLGVDSRVGAAISGCLVIAVFLARSMFVVFDRTMMLLGIVKIVLIVVLVAVTAPPLGQVAIGTVAPKGLPLLAVLTLIGGTVGGFITYSGAHRLIDAGITGVENVRRINRGAWTGVLVACVLRIVLFLGFFGVVATGAHLANPNDAAGSSFLAAFGTVGLHLFGLVFWAAGMTSTMGNSYTTATFLQTYLGPVRRHFNRAVIVLIGLATVVFVAAGQTPQSMLVFAGAINGLVLPVGLAIILWVALRRRELIAGYRYPSVLLGAGVAAWLFTAYAAVLSITSIGSIFR
ncbi:NRAMP family divalent metal transporter [Pseudonocardia spinosispora]|uniref:NRAMP family divalent metal transporter n=1 Tax=Pseudonocardia spinosispora TaxID=103441 RepID=UPI000406433C|nr:NRAMP family divalent metal transporter [Pseudonocardia spinosispora]